MKQKSRCPFCDSEQEPRFQVCWNCGRELQTGQMICNVEVEPAQLPERLNQFDLNSLILNTAAAAMVLQILVLKPTMVETPIRFTLFILGAGYLSLQLSIWIIFNLAAACRNRSD